MLGTARAMKAARQPSSPETSDAVAMPKPAPTTSPVMMKP